MSRFGWAYVNDVITGSGGTPGGSDKAIQFASGSSFSGSTNFTFDYNTNTVRLTGTLYADNLIVSSSQILKSGSTIFGDSAGDTHQFTGSIYGSSALVIAGASTIGGTLDVDGKISGTTGQFTTITSQNVTINNSATIKNGLVVTGTVSASSFVGDGNNITGINGANVNGVGNDWTIQFKNGVGATLTGSSNLTFSGSTFILSGNLNVTGAIKGGYATYSSNTSIPNTSYFVGLNSVSSALTASLLGSSNYPQGQTLIFKDIGGYAGTNNILIKASGSETIDGASGVSLTANSSSVSIISNGSNGFYIIGTV